MSIMSSCSQDPLDLGQGMMRAWTDLASKMMTAGLSLSPESTPPEAAREIRSNLLSAWADHMQQFFRSPMFLEAMRKNLDFNVQARKQLNEYLGQVQHEFQGVSRQDVDHLMRAMRHVEQRSVDGLERISSQLDDLSQRLDCLEKQLKNRAERHSHERKE
jgi:septal ring factor EnvC (AmiA/AmiB activator)